MNHFAIEWFKKEEEKQAERRNKNETHLINQQLSHLISRLQGDVEPEKYEEQESFYTRHLVRSSIWYLCYANNFENPFVMFVQCSWIQLVLDTETDLDDARYYQSELKRLYRLAQQHDYNQSLKASREFDNLQKLR